MSVARLLSTALIAAAAPCQLSLSTLTAPMPWPDPAYYDQARDVLVCWGTNAMWEFDGANWTMIPCATLPTYGALNCAFDPFRRRFVAHDFMLATMWEWDGSAWINLGPAAIQAYSGMTYHAGRQRVVALSDMGLQEWGGSGWSVVPQLNPPPTLVNIWSHYSYGPMVYDERWGKLVLFDRVLYQHGIPVLEEQATFEWDPVNDWAQLPTLPGPTSGEAMWYDAHRGSIVRGYTYGGPAHGFYYRDAARNWVQLTTGPLPLGLGCLDAVRNRYYFGYQANTIGIIHSNYPAEFVAHATGCTSASVAPIALSASWTRAWIGETFSIDVPVPQSLAILAMGFSDQLSGSTPLPLPLAGYGMPGCTLRVAPDATLLAFSPSPNATFTLSIPNAPALLATTFWDQALVLATGANAAGLLATDSVRATVGQFR